MENLHTLRLWKRLLSVVLTFALTLSCVSPGITVLAQELTAEESTIQETRDLRDQTENTAALRLTLEKASYLTKDIQQQESLQSVVINDNILDLSATDPAFLSTLELTFAFNLLALGEEGIKRGDTFTLTLPKSAQDERYFTLENTEEDMPLVVGKDAATVQIGTYSIKDDTVTATFDGVAEGLAEDNRRGELTLKTTVDTTILSTEDTTAIDFNLQNVVADAEQNVTEADVKAATSHFLMPKLKTEEAPAASVEAEPTVTGEEEVSSTPEASEPTAKPENTTPFGKKALGGITATEDGSSTQRMGLLSRLFAGISTFATSGSYKAATITNGTIANPATTGGTANAFKSANITFKINKDGYDVDYSLANADKKKTIDFTTELRLSDEYLAGVWDQAIAGDDKLEGLYEAAINAEIGDKPGAYQALNDALRAEKIEQVTYTYNFGADFKLPDSEMNAEGKPKSHPLNATIDGIEQQIASYIYKEVNGELLAEVTFEPFVCCMESVKAQFAANLFLADSLFVDSDKVDVSWDGDKAIIEVVGRLENKDKPTKDTAFTSDKTAAYTDGNLYIDYTIKFSQAADAAEVLNGAVMVDALPKGLTVETLSLKTNGGESVPLTKEDTPSGTTYQLVTDKEGNNTLKYAFPEGDSITSAEFTLRAVLTPEAYQDYMNQGSTGINTTYKNSAYLKSANESEIYKKTPENTTTMKASFFTKDGHQNEFNGNIFDWEINVNTYFSQSVGAYIVDEIDASQNTLIGESLKVRLDNGEETTIPVKDATGDLLKYGYGQLTNGNLADVGQEDSALRALLLAQTNNGANAIMYTIGEGKDARQIVIIPFDTYVNHNAKINYSTELTEEAKQTNTTTNAADLKNIVKMIWKTFGYGPGPGTPLDWNIDISKDVTNTYNLVQKNATQFNADNHTQGWQFKINQYQQAITNLVITEELGANGLSVADTDNWTYTYYKGGVLQGAENQKISQKGLFGNTTPYYEVEKSADGKETVSFHFGDLQKEDYYVLNIITDVTDQLATGAGADAGGKTVLKNTAKVTTGPEGQETTTESPAEIQVENVLIKKDTTSGYNALDHSIGWKVAINSQKLDLSDAVLTDILPEGNVFKSLEEVTRTYKDKNGQEQTQIGTINGNEISFSGTSIKVTQNEEKAANTSGTSQNKVTWTFNNEKNDESTYTFSFTTQMGTTAADKTYLDNLIDRNTADAVINNAQLSGKIGNNTIKDSENHNYVADSAPASVADKALSKTGHYNETAVEKDGQIIHEAGTITWSVVLNQGQIDMTGKRVVEDFTDNSILQLVIPAKGNPVKVEAADMKGSAIGEKTDETEAVKDAFTAVTPMGFTFTVPASVLNKVLIFTFDTYITDDANLSEVKNTIKLMPASGDTADETVTGGNDGTGDFWVDDSASGKINPYLKVSKVSESVSDNNANLIALSGAVFESTAYDWNEQAQAYVKTDGTTTSKVSRTTGKANFMNLHRDRVYKIVEISAPAGYGLSSTPHYVIFGTDGADGTHKTPGEIKIKESAGGGIVTLTTEQVDILKTTTKAFTYTMKDTPSTTFSFIKYGADGTTPLPNVTFTLTRTTDNKVAKKEAVSDASGVVTFANLDPGDYLLTETGVDKEYDTQGAYTITVGTDGSITYKVADEKAGAAFTLSGTGTNADPYKVVNRYVKGRIKIKKYDSEINENNIANVLPVGGAIYGLYTKNADGTYTAVPDVSNVQTQYSPKGEATFVNVPYSAENYYIHEVTPATGYTLNSEYHEVTVDDMKKGMTGTENKSFSVSKDLTDTRVRGSITLTKTHKKDNVDTTPLADREFEITYTDRDGYTAWQTSIQANGAPLTAKDGKYYAKTNVNGAIALTNVPYGNYTLTEVFPENDKYQGPKTITITREEVIKGRDSILQKSLNNELRKGAFSIVKTDTYGDTLPNVTFDLKGENLEGTDVDGNTFEPQMIKTEAGEAQKGTITFKNLPIGDYTLTEAVPYGFTAAKTTCFIKVEAEGSGTKVSYSTTKGGTYTVLGDKSKLKIENTPITGSLSFTKVDSEGRKLAGIAFKLQRILYTLGEDGKYTTTYNDVRDANNQIIQKTSSADGQVTFNDLPYGNYQVVEVNQTGISDLSPTKIYRVGEGSEGSPRFTVERDNSSFSMSDLTVTNTLKKATINLTKVDENNTALSGIAFTVQRQGTAEENDPNSFILRGWTESGDEYNDYQVPSTTEASGWTTLKGTTGADGKLSLGSLVEGNYRLVETLPVNTTSGQTTNPVTFTVSDGKITNLKVNGKDVSTTGDTSTANITVANQIKYGYVNFKKVSDGTGANLPGTTFTIYTKNGETYTPFVTDIAVDKNGNLISDSDGSYGTDKNKKWLVYGTYYLKETGALGGFTANANYHEFTIGEDTTGHQGTAWISADAGETGTVTYKKATAGITTPQIDTTTFINTAIRGSISLTKVDAGDTTKAVSGAVFTVYDGTTAVATLTESTTTPGTYDVVTSLDKDKNMGTSTTAINIPYIQEGKFLAGTYTIKETTTPGNYQKVDANTILKTVVIAAGGTTAYYNGDQTQTSGNSQVTNTLLTGSLTIKKYNGLTDILEYEVYKEKMAGVIFTLTGNDLNGNPIGTDGKGITVKTDAKGEATFTGIPLGNNYTLSETPVPGYVTMTPKTVKLTAEDHTAKVEMDGKLPENGVFKITNTPITGTLSFTKNAGSNRTLQGVEFELIGVYDGRTVFTKIVKSDENGKVTFENIPYVNYRIEEKTKDIVNGMPEQSISTSDLTISEDNTTFTGTVTYGTKGTGIVDNTLNTNGVLKFTKVDQNGKAIKIAGISFEVYRKGSSGENNKFNLYPGSDEAYQPYYVAVQTDSEATGEYKKCIVTTNEDGYIAQGFPIGEYKLVEVVDATNPIHQALTGTQPLEATFKVELDRYKDLVIVNAEGLKPSGYKYTFTNNITYGTLQIQKVFGEQDSNTAGQTLPTATFDIFRRIGDTQPGAEDKPVTTLTTNDKGQFDTTSEANTLMGGDYWLKEVSTTNDTYAVDSTYYPFTIKDQEETVVSTRTAEDEHQVFNNAAKRGTLTVTKLDEKYDVDADGNLVAKTGEDGQKLGGADFILVADDKLMTHLQDNKDGTYSLPDTANAAEAVTVEGKTYTPAFANALGASYILGGKILIGDYQIIEVKAPAGYTEKTTPVEVTINEDTAVQAATQKITNVLIEQPFKITKSVEVPSSDTAVNGVSEAVANTAETNGFTFTIERRTTTDPIFAYKKTVTTAEVSGEKGIADFGNVPYGTYSVTETASDSTGKYLLPETAIGTLTVNKDGAAYAQADGTTGTAGNAAITNTLKRGTITGSKVDTTTKAGETYGVAGATMAIYHTEADAKANINAVAKAVVTGEDGTYSFTNMPYNSAVEADADAYYYIKETIAPEGYVLSDTIVKVKLQNADGVNGQTVTAANIVDEPNRSSFTLKKVDTDNKNTGLQGVSFTLKGTNTAGKAIADITKTTNAAGSITFSDVPYGSYTLTETVPDAYTGTADYAVTIDSNGITIDQASKKDGETFEISNSRIRGNIAFTKTEKDTSRFLGGITFKLYRTGETTPVATATSDVSGKVIFTDVPFAAYDIKEVVQAGVDAGDAAIDAEILCVAVAADTLKAAFKTESKTYTFDQGVNNSLKTTDLSFTKVDQNGAALGEGITFNLTRLGSGGGVEGFYLDAAKADKNNQGTYFNYTAQPSVTTDANGVVLVKGLPLGSYRLTEDLTTLPAPGANEAKVLTFTVAEKTDGTLEIADKIGFEADGSVKNTMKNGTLQINKVFGEVENNLDAVTRPQATFEIYKDATLFLTLETNAKGQFTIAGDGSYTDSVTHAQKWLIEGDYTIKETAVSDANYYLDTTTYSFSIKDGEETTVFADTDNTKIQNTPARAAITLKKTDKEAIVGTNGTNVDLALYGAEFAVVLPGTTTAVAVITDDGDGSYSLKEVAPLESIKDYTLQKANTLGVPYIYDGKLLYGNYELHETQAPAGYEASANPVALIYIDKDKNTVTVGENTDDTGHAEITNVTKKNDIKVSKLVETVKENQTEFQKTHAADSAGNGFVFTITRVKETDGSAPRFTYSATSRATAEGSVTFSQVPVGIYEIKEVSGPDAYVIDATVIKTIMVNNAGIVTDVDGKLLSGVSFSNSLKRGSIEGIKTDVTTNAAAAHVVEGATIGLFTQDGKTQLAEAQTNKDGKYTFSNIPYGSYLIQETKAPVGYVLNTTPVSVVVSAEGQTVTADAIDNVMLKGSFSLKKVDGETGAALAGAEFSLSGTNSYGDAISFDAQVTPDTGIVTFDNLPLGTYTLSESKLPEGYSVPMENRKVTVSAKPDASTAEVTLDGNLNQEEAGTYRIGNIGNKGTIVFTKYGKSNENDLDAKAPLAGAEFSLYQDAACTQLVTTTASDAKGQVVFDAIHFGTYYIKETKVPENYTGDTTVYKAIINKDGSYDGLYAGEEKTDAVVNEAIRGSISLKKIDATAGNALSGVTFGIYKAGSDTALATAVTDGEGKLTFENLLMDTAYTIKETATLSDYLLSAESRSVTLKNTATQKDITLGDWTNTPVTMQFNKVDSVGGALTGAEFTLYQDAACTVALKSAVSDADGVVTYTHLDKGTTYYVKETAAPEGYFLNEQIFQVVIDAAGTGVLRDNDETIKEVVNNEKGSILLNKLEANTQAALSGAVFQLLDEKDQVIAEKTSDEKGQIRFSELPLGTYRIVEKTAPEGYVLSTEVTTLTLQKGTENQITSRTNSKASFSFSKRVKYLETCYKPEATKFLAGVTFTLYSDRALKHKIAEATSDADGRVSFSNVPTGTSYMQETVVPGKHVALDSTVRTVDIDAYGNTTIDGENTAQTTIVNDMNRANIVLKKVDETNPDKALPNSTYGLYRSAGAVMEGQGIQTMAEGEDEEICIATATTGTDGYLRFEGILTGVNYTVRELEAPEGSQVSEQPIQITFDVNEKGETKITKFEDGNGTAKVDENGDIIWYEPPTMAKIYKKDTNGSLLAGAKLRITNEDGTAVEGLEDWVSSDKDGQLIQGILVEGKTYVLTELEAPAGYQLAAPIRFTMSDRKVGPNENFVQTWVMVDEAIPNIDNPNTPNNPGNNTIGNVLTGVYGQTNGMTMTIMLALALLAIALTTTIIFVRKRKDN